MIKRESPLKVIRRNCVECSGGSFREVKFCRAFDCQMWKFRFGVRPETAERKHPELLDPESVELLGDIQCCQEMFNEMGKRVLKTQFFEATTQKVTGVGGVVEAEFDALVAKIKGEQSNGEQPDPE